LASPFVLTFYRTPLMTELTPEQEALVEAGARLLDPEAWADDLPVPTREHVAAFHFRRQQSAHLARAIIPLIFDAGRRAGLEEAAKVADQVAKTAHANSAVFVEAGAMRAATAIRSLNQESGRG
jgi:hypothetical protein